MDQRKRERESTFSSSNETQSSYLPSLPAPKPLSVALFPTSATLQSHHPFRHAAVPPKFPLSSSIPSHWLSSPLSPSFPNQASHSALPKLKLCKSIETAREARWPLPVSGCGGIPVHSLAPLSMARRKGAKSLWMHHKSQSLGEPAIYKGMRVSQSPDLHTDTKVHP